MKSAMMMVLWASVALGDVGPRPVCRADADCVMASFSCCGSCCPAPAQAWLRSELERRQARCAVMKCARETSCPPCADVLDEPRIAACVQGQCVARSAANADPDFCATDAECVSSTFAGCCGSCCPVAPYAISRRRAAIQTQNCARRDCARPSCAGVACIQVVPSPIRPVCRANRCVAERANVIVPPPPPPAQCQADAECGVDLNPPPGSACWSSPCGCCPSPRAVPIEQVRPPPVRSAGSPGGSPFGLSQGNSASSPTCSPCPSVGRASAQCVQGQCRLR
jgi:hypothetical protein